MSLEIFGSEISLGMSRAQALKGFRDIDLECVGEKKKPRECDSVIVRSGTWPKVQMHGNIYFEAGKVRHVMKYWPDSQDDPSAIAFAETLFRILDQQPSPTRYDVALADSSQQGVRQWVIELRSGRRFITISYAAGIRGEGGDAYRPFVTLSENIK